MITFAQYFTLSESVVSGISPEHLGLKSMNSVPPSPVYGFWVDRSGNYIECKYVGHYDAAKKILLAAYAIKGEAPPPTITDKAAYGALFDAHFIRVVRSGDYYYYEPQSITPRQEMFLKRLCHEHGMSYKYETEFL